MNFMTGWGSSMTQVAWSQQWMKVRIFRVRTGLSLSVGMVSSCLVREGSMITRWWKYCW